MQHKWVVGWTKMKLNERGTQRREALRLAWPLRPLIQSHAWADTTTVTPVDARTCMEAAAGKMHHHSNYHHHGIQQHKY